MLRAVLETASISCPVAEGDAPCSQPRLGGLARVGLAAVLPVALLLVTLSLGACSEAPPPPEPPARNLILVTVDTLRPDHMSLFGYERATTPELERWFADDVAAVYERSYSTEAATAPSVVSVLSGLHPQDHRVRLLQQLVPESTAIVTDMLPETYETAAFVSNAVLSNEAIGIGDRFDHYDDFVDQAEPNRPVYERNARRTTDAVLDWMTRRDDTERPVFLWVHYIDPHGPYLPPEPPEWERRYTHPEPETIDTLRVPLYSRIDGVTDGLDYVDRYDEEITYTDREIGRLLEGLDAELNGGLDEALVVFTADHGEAMMDHESWFTHGYHVYEEIVRVPMMVRGVRAGVVPGRTASPVSGVDVVPTLLGAAGVQPPSNVKGADLRRSNLMQAHRVVMIEASDNYRQVRGLVRGSHKILAGVSPEGEITGWGLIDLDADPDEIEWAPLVTGERLRATLQEMIRRDPDPGGLPSKYAEGVKLTGPKVAPGVEGAQLDRLRKLGYVE